MNGTPWTDRRKTYSRYALLALIVAVNLYKITLAGSGFLALYDEKRIMKSNYALNHFQRGEIDSAINMLFSTEARPGAATINLIPIAAMRMNAHFRGLSLYESRNSYPLFFFNLAIHCMILVVLYRLSFRLLNDDILSLFAVTAYSCLTNSNINLRHAFPYDACLLINLSLIRSILSNTENNGTNGINSFCLGLLSFLAYLVYPGYIKLFAASGMFFFFLNLTRRRTLETFRDSFFYAAGILTCLVSTQILSMMVGKSYLRSAMDLSKTLHQGSFEESFSFMFKYLYEVEGISGVLLILSLALFCIATARNLIKGNIKFKSPILILSASFFILYMFWAIEGYFLHKCVFTGRIIHLYIPFFCIFMAYAVRETIPSMGFRSVLTLLVSLVFITDFFVKTEHYKSFAYHRDVIWSMDEKYKVGKIERICEDAGGRNQIPVKTVPGQSRSNDAEIYEGNSLGDNPSGRRGIHDGRVAKNLIYVNFCYTYPETDMSNYRIFKPSADMDLLFSKPHFLNFKGYQYESFSIQGRNNLDKMNLQIAVYSLKDTATKYE